ncbi:MAG: hypothetical protein WCF33_17645 [Pseudonocardiaceae bacterium]
MAGRHHRVAAPPGFQRRAAPVASAPTLPPLAIEMMDSFPNVTHRVTDEAMAGGRRVGGRHRAIWGARVFVTSGTAPVWQRCPRCALWASS